MLEKSLDLRTCLVCKKVMQVCILNMFFSGPVLDGPSDSNRPVHW